MLEDSAIIALYNERNEEAIAATRTKYGRFCYAIAMNILHQTEEAEECESDTYHSAWRHIPPDQPGYLRGYLGKITRRLSISRYRKNHAAKRDGGMELVLDELEQCIPSGECPEQQLEAKELGELISQWLKGLPKDQRQIFVRRYWYGDSLEDLAKKTGLPKALLSQRLSRMRSRLKTCLEGQGVQL